MTFHDPTIEPKGMYPKYLVFKHPRFEEIEDIYAVALEQGASRSTALEQVEDFVFVLKPLKDPAARVAMAAYAEAKYPDDPQLAKDMWEILSDFR